MPCRPACWTPAGATSGGTRPACYLSSTGQPSRDTTVRFEIDAYPDDEPEDTFTNTRLLIDYALACKAEELVSYVDKACNVLQTQEGTAEWEKIANEAARTIPGRENGGNCDIKNLGRGSKVYLPVFVEGANLSTGDMHFSQGDGEVSFCGAIEMSGFLELKCEIIRGGMKEYLTPVGPSPLHVNPIFEIGPVEPHFSEWLVFEGISVDESGKQHFLDASVAYKRAVLNAIEYLSRFGYSKEQVYILLSCCPCEGRISGIVDAPNAVATLAIPTVIFDQDIKPKRLGNGPKLRRFPDVLR
ncbi:unnamed protein product [Triticum turgidum subsp. durum]|uniref:Formamidase n=1 Tax=Triticum turgidum subsp. durum TaxID=4567 RepID=A0A9R0Y8S0_TRITD|nr:unnamed protein product [Triticum turgidum subsp. durum]